MGALIEIVGKRFSRLVVLRRAPNRKGEARAYWECVCDCGKTAEVSGKYLRNGTTSSCGCLQSEISSAWMSSGAFSAIRSGKITHGHKRKSGMSPEYRTWLGIKRRCYDQKCKDYPTWGGRGIIVCDEWKSDFRAFFRDMGEKPSTAHQIDRIDPNGPYSKENCRWVTPSVQGAENRRNIYKIDVEGLSFPSISAACEHFGINKTTVHYRLGSGVPISEAFHQGRMISRRSKQSYLPKYKR